MKTETKRDIIGLGIAYLGMVFMTAWGIWSISTKNFAFVDLTGFIHYLGGLL